MENIEDLFDEGHDKKDLQDKSLSPINQVKSDNKNDDLSNLFDEGHKSVLPEPAGMSESIQAHSEAEKPTQLGALGRGAAQGLTLGFGPKIAGAGEALWDKAISNESTKDMPLADLYSMYRDIQRAKNKQAEEAFPKTFLAGNVVGGFAPAIATGGSLPALIGTGAAMGLGTSESEDVGGMAKDAAIGAGLGALGAGAGKVVGKGLSLAGKVLNPKTVQNIAARQIEGAVGIPKTATSETIGQTLMKEEAVPMTGGMKGMAEGIETSLENKGKELNDVLKEAQKHIELQTPEGMPVAGSSDLGATVLNRFNNDILGKLNRELPEDAKAMKNIVENSRPFVRKIIEAGDDLVELNKIKQDIYRYTRSLSKNAWKENKNVDPEVNALKQLGGMVREHIEKTADSLNDQQLGGAIKKLNQEWADLSTSANAVEKAQQNALQAERAPIENQIKKNLVTSGIPAAMAKVAGLGSPGMIAAGVAGYGAKKGIEAATGYPIKQASQIMASKAIGGLGKGMEKVTEASERTFGLTPAEAGKITAEKAIASPFTQDVVSGRNNNLNQGYMVYQASDEQLKNYYNQIKDKPTLSSVSSALDRYFKTGDVMDKNKAAFLIQSTPEAKEALGLK